MNRLLLIVLLVGIVIGAVAFRESVFGQNEGPVGTALIDDTSAGLKPATVAVTKWEYKMVSGGELTNANAVASLNAAGGEGWELVAFTVFGQERASRSAYFKRPLRAAEKPAAHNHENDSHDHAH